MLTLNVMIFYRHPGLLLWLKCPNQFGLYMYVKAEGCCSREPFLASSAASSTLPEAATIANSDLLVDPPPIFI